MPEGVTWQIVLILLLIAVNGFFALSEIALVQVRATQVSHLVEREAAGARRLRDLTRDPSRFLSTIQVAITVSGFLASASASAILAEPIADALRAAGITGGWVSGFAVLTVTAAVSYLSLVFGELVPKQIALRSPEGVALRVARPISWFARLFHPFVIVLSASSRGVLRIVGVKPGAEKPRITEEELRRLVVEQRSLKDEEKAMIEGVFRFGDTLVREVMVPRADVVSVPAGSPVKDSVTVLLETSHSQAPVTDGDLDRTVGIVTVNDLLEAVTEGHHERPVDDFCREPVHVPETQRAIDLLQRIRQRPVHLVLVVDEYGSATGIVTAADLIEEIVGDFRAPDERPIVELADGDYLVSGGQRIEDVNAALAIALPVRDLYETLAGFVLDRFQKIPSQGESIEHAGLRLTVAEMDGHRIERVRITRVESDA